MTDADLKKQPSSVRDEFNKIQDAAVDSDQAIVIMLGELKTALAKSSEAHAQYDRIRSILGNLQSEIAQAKGRIEEIDAQRAESIATSLIEGVGFAQDDDLIATRREFDLYVERLTLARPALELQQRSANRAVDIASGHCSDIEDKVNNRRDELKLQESRRRHGLG